MKIVVPRAGTWGTALASLLANNHEDVTLWSAPSRELDTLKSERAHKNLPGVKLPDGIKYEKDMKVEDA